MKISVDIEFIKQILVVEDFYNKVPEYFFLKDAAKKGLSSFSHIVVVVPFFELAEFLDSDLDFFGSLKITLELRIIWFRQKGTIQSI